MTLYPFEMQLAVDANNPGVVVQSGSITIYDPEDVDMLTPLALLDPQGLPMANPFVTSAQGFVSKFQAEIPHIMWSDGTYSGYLSSYKGLLDEAIAARTAAEAALLAAQALIMVIGPADPWPTGQPDGTLVVRTAT